VGAEFLLSSYGEYADPDYCGDDGEDEEYEEGEWVVLEYVHCLCFFLGLGFFLNNFFFEVLDPHPQPFSQKEKGVRRFFKFFFEGEGFRNFFYLL